MVFYELAEFCFQIATARKTIYNVMKHFFGKLMDIVYKRMGLKEHYWTLQKVYARPEPS